MRILRILPMVLAFPLALAFAIGTPVVYRELFPPAETIEELVALSLAKPKPAPPVHYDIVYRRSMLRSYCLDLYEPLDLPETTTDPPSADPPIVVFFHGGSWLRGDKVTILVIDRFLERMRRAGYFVAAVNYTTSPLRGLAGPIRNGTEALWWIIENAERYGYAPDHIGLYGVSAGGHVALMSAAIGEYPHGAIDWVFAECAPTDLVGMRSGDAFENSAGFRFFPERRLELLSPITYVDRMPPVYIFHGDADETVHVNQSRRFVAALRDTGGEVRYLEWPGGDHAFLGYSDQIWYEQESIALDWFAAGFRDGR